MKIIELKILNMFYVELITLAIVLHSFGGVGGGLYAQNPEIFEHTWYFVNGEYDGEEFISVSDLQGELDFTLDALTVNHFFCEEGGGGTFTDLQNNNFILDDFFVALVGTCGEPFLTEFLHKHYSIYGDYEDTGIANNPFQYLIETIEDYYQLTIENGVGDWAVYNSVLLSTQGFNQNNFTIYPNPVKETLNLKNSSNQQVTATVYDIDGKLLLSHFLEDSTATVDVRALKQGLYFVVFENESGERVSKKFIKY